MVSKVAVIALVAIIAAPILLGFGMNFNLVNESRYVDSDQKTNVTDLLNTSTAYSYNSADTYALNADNIATDLVPNSYQSEMRVLPIYENIMSTRSPLPLMVRTGSLLDTQYNLSEYAFLEITNTGSSLSAQTLGGDEPSINVNYVKSIVYDGNSGKIYVSRGADGSITLTDDDAIQLRLSGTASADVVTYYAYNDQSLNTTYADLTKGFKFPNHKGYLSDNAYPKFTYWISPGDAESILMTIDLSTIPLSESNAVFNFRASDNVDRVVNLKISGTVGNISFDVYDNLSGSGSPVASDIIYDNVDSSNNVYQILVTRSGAELRYIGSWPTTFGAANVYRTYSFDWATAVDDHDFLKGFQYTYGSNPGIAGSAVIRIDQAIVRVAEYPAMYDTTYNPAYITGYANMNTTVNVVSPGTSLVFGGITYPITNGDITLGTHKVAVNGLKLTSVYDAAAYRYVNSINGYEISTTPNPSTITFNGQWGNSNIVTNEMVVETYNGYKWISGEFAWDGIDSNFLMVGLLTSLGVFIALGIYSRRSKASVWPLMLVAGGAAFLFLIMM